MRRTVNATTQKGGGLTSLLTTMLAKSYGAGTQIIRSLKPKALFTSPVAALISLRGLAQPAGPLAKPHVADAPGTLGAQQADEGQRTQAMGETAVSGDQFHAEFLGQADVQRVVERQPKALRQPNHRLGQLNCRHLRFLIISGHLR